MKMYKQSRSAFRFKKDVTFLGNATLIVSSGTMIFPVGSHDAMKRRFSSRDKFSQFFRARAPLAFSRRLCYVCPLFQHETFWEKS